MARNPKVRRPKVRRPKARRPKPKARSDSIVKSEGDRSSGGALSINHASKTIRVDWSRLSPPTDIYDADFAWAEERHGAVSGDMVKSCVWEADQAASFLTPSTKATPPMTSVINR